MVEFKVGDAVVVKNGVQGHEGRRGTVSKMWIHDGRSEWAATVQYDTPHYLCTEFSYWTYNLQLERGPW